MIFVFFAPNVFAIFLMCKGYVSYGISCGYFDAIFGDITLMLSLCDVTICTLPASRSADFSTTEHCTGVFCAWIFGWPFPLNPVLFVSDSERSDRVLFP